MSQKGKERAEHEVAGTRWVPIVVVVLSILALLLSGYSASSSSAGASAQVWFLLAQAVVISIVIWQACEPFADAAQWIGNTFHIPGSVRGATLDAIASSMPELLTGIFFVLVAVAAGGPSSERPSAEGYGSAVATAAGSAVYNMILIPAFCALVISFKRRTRPTIDVGPEVIGRDGLLYLGCVALFIVFLLQNQMHWWMGAAFLALYALYVIWLIAHTWSHRRKVKAIHAQLEGVDDSHGTDRIVEQLRDRGVAASAEMVDRYRYRQAAGRRGRKNPSAGIFFASARVPLNHLTAWIVILVSTIVAAAACYWLVHVTNATAEALSRLIGRHVPVFFVAVILTAAASSIPDTFLSIGAAVRGDDSGAVSNAFGSNIFDLCLCLSLALLVNSALLGWGPVPLTQDGEPMTGLLDLCILLGTLSLITLLIMSHKRQLTRGKAIVLIGLYGVFIAYAVVGSLGFSLLEWTWRLIEPLA